ncbi:hypothetical protein RSW37_26475, partial [Escherichia coli]|uniref:hypothetical protein n=1 Tax=Escherichia coli TaxID=562 RepID=UPI0028E074FB
VIDDLRSWKLWQHTDTILLLTKKDRLPKFVERSILRYMISCPHAQYPKAKEYAEKIQKEHPEKYHDAVELLKQLEAA